MSSIQPVNVGYTAPTSTTSGPQGRVDAAIGKINSLSDAIAGLSEALALIRSALIELELELANLEAPRASDYKKTETRTEGSPPKTVTVVVLDNAAFNAAMSTYLSKLRDLQGKVTQKRSELATKEGELAQKQKDLADAKTELAAAQSDLQGAQNRDYREIIEAQRRYDEAMRKADEASRAALEAQAQAQKAQDDLALVEQALSEAMSAALELGGIPPEEAEEFLAEEPLSFVLPPETDEAALAAFEEASGKAIDNSYQAIKSACDHLPQQCGDKVLPPRTALDQADLLELTPRLASVEDGVTAAESGLLLDLAGRADEAPLTTAELAKIIDTWRAAGFSEETLRAAVNQVLPPQSYTGMTPEDLASAQDVMMNAANDPQALADWFAAHPDSATQAQMFDLMTQYGATALLLDRCGCLGEESKQMLADALEVSYVSGSLSNEEWASIVTPSGSPVELHLGLAEIVGMTGNTAIIETYVQKEMEVIASTAGTNMDNGYRWPAVAIALAGLPPEDFQSYLASNPEQVKAMMAGIRYADQFHGTAGQNAIAALLDTASELPLSKETLALFASAIPHIGDNIVLRDAASRFYIAHGDEILVAWSRAEPGVADGEELGTGIMGGPFGSREEYKAAMVAAWSESGDAISIGAGEQALLASFFAQTLFSDPAFASQEALQNKVGEQLEVMFEILCEHGEGDVPPGIAGLASTMGSFIGCVEQGFLLAVDKLEEENESIDHAVDFVITLGGFLAEATGGGPVKFLGEAVDKFESLSDDGLKDAIKKALHKKADDPRAAAPFYFLYRDYLPRGEIATSFDTSRGATYDNKLYLGADAEP